jgi:bifunctional non-homologous end joining protein LigD
MISALHCVFTLGTGFTHDQSRMMRQKLKNCVTNRPAILKLKKPRARWVKPIFLAKVEYFEISKDGSLRHPVLRGFRPPARIDVFALRDLRDPAL